jgi:antitoxin (DNA-binding transcriptional repressor) of toxin-antitoxin stability system
MALLEEIERTGDSLVITKEGKPIAKVVPHQRAELNPFGIWKDKVIIKGDIISPIDVEWEALK